MKYITAKELSKKTGIPTYEIRELGMQGKIDTHKDGFDVIYPITVLVQLKALGYLGIPIDSEPEVKKVPVKKIWINNGEEERYIPSDQPIPDGFEKGRSKRLREAISKSKSGKIMVNKDGKYEMIDPGELPSYIQEGWKEGRIPGTYNTIEGRVTINNGKRETFIGKHDPIPEGWSYGRLLTSGSTISKSLTGRAWVFKDNEERRIPEDELDEYLDDGWEQGRAPRKKIE